MGLGANVGDVLAAFDAAASALEALGRIVAVSALYETDPVGPPQPMYLNAAIRLETALAPGELLEELLSIERQQGRERRERWGPRCLDLDILWISGLRVRTPHLEVPHPELEKRAFALLPLLDVAPNAAAPGGGERYATLAARLDRSGARRIAGTSAGRWRRSRNLGSGRPPA